MSKNKTGLFLGGLLMGTTLGTIMGVLLAPRTGKDTRRIIKKSAEALPELAEDLSTTVQMQADRLSESAKSNWDDTLVKLKEAIAAGMEASQMKTEELQKSQEVSSNSHASVPEQHL